MIKNIETSGSFADTLNNKFVVNDLRVPCLDGFEIPKMSMLQRGAITLKKLIGYWLDVLLLTRIVRIM